MPSEVHTVPCVLILIRKAPRKTPGQRSRPFKSRTASASPVGGQNAEVLLLIEARDSPKAPQKKYAAARNSISSRNQLLALNFILQICLYIMARISNFGQWRLMSQIPGRLIRRILRGKPRLGMPGVIGPGRAPIDRLRKCGLPGSNVAHTPESDDPW